MRQIKELIVVEGRHDSANLLRYFKVETIETGGTKITTKLLKELKEISKERAIIVFCDPDNSGELIRRRLSAELPDCLHAYLSADKCRHKTKVGIEHAKKADLEAALEHLISYQESSGSLKPCDLLDLGLSGHPLATKRRALISEKYHLGDTNGKSLLKRLNVRGINKEELERVLADDY